MGNIASDNSVEQQQQQQVNVTNRDATQKVALRAEQLFELARTGPLWQLKSIIASEDVHAVDDNGYSLLHYAAEHGSVVVCYFLLEKGADANAGRDTITPLHLACSKGHLPLVKLFISSGADMNVIDGDGDSLLHYAAEHRNATICQYLLDKGADVNAGGDMYNPLLAACCTGHLPVVKLLISCGSFNLNSSAFRMPLYCALIYGHTAIGEYLLKNGSDIDAVDEDEMTLLHVACSEGRSSMVTFLISHSASLNSIDFWKRTPLHYAAEYGHLAACQYLMDKGADVDAVDEYSKTPLILASSKGHLSVVKLLVIHGADVYKFSNRAREEASRAGHTFVVEYLNKIS